MLDFNINEFDINKNYSLSASAGTGKTYTIVEILKKLIANKINEDKIVIVTYTEKAAGELKLRIKKDIPHFNLDKAHIGTIHSFCKEVIDEYYFSMGLPSSLTIVDNSLMESVYNRLLREYLYNGKIILKDIGDKEDKRIIYKIVEKLYLDANGNIDPKIVSFPKLNIYESIDLDMHRLIGKEESEVFDYFINFENENDSEFASFIREFFAKVKKEVAMDNKQMIKFWNSLYGNICEHGRFEYNGNYLKFDKIASPLLKKIKDASNRINLYKDISISLYKQWQEVKHRNKWFTYDDMLREVREAIVCEGSILKDKLQTRYEYALIDEFQDTNRLQWDIFKNIFLDGENNHIIVVGDRKQSIYAFQGADLTVYDEAIKEIESKGGCLRNLPNNYRSSASMISSYNELFKMEGFKSIGYDIPVGVGNHNFDARIDGKSIKGISIVSKLPVSEGESDLAIISPSEYAQVIVQMILDYCSLDEKGKTKLQVYDQDGILHNVSFKDFMILARTRKEFFFVENELKEAGIPFVKFKDTDLFSGFECAHWISLINVLLKEDFTGSNRKAFRKVLYTKFFDKSLQEISSPYFDTDSSEEMDLILKWKALANEHKYTELINSIFQDSKIEQRMASLTAIQSLNVFKQIGDFALEYLLDGNSLSNLKNKLIKLSDNNQVDEEEGNSIVEKGTDFDCVELLTIHASKGLERGIVFIVGGERELRKESKVSIYHEQEEGVNKPYLTLNNNKKDQQDEFDRLFYVAYTRARYLLVLPNYKKNNDIPTIEVTKQFLDYDKDNVYHEDIIYHEHKTNKEEIKQKVNKIITANTKKDEEEKGEKENQLKILRDLSKNMNKHSVFKHSYASLSKVKESENIWEENLNANKEGEEGDEILNGFDLSMKTVPLPYLDIEPNQIPEGFPRGSDIGTALHEIFEKFEFTNIDSENNLDDIIDERLKYNHINNSPVFSSYIKNMVQEVLNAALPTIHGNEIDIRNTFRLKEIKKEDRKAEIEFNFKLGDFDLSSYCNGFIDLVFKKDNHYCILDWKSDTTNDNDLLSYNKLEDIKKRVDNHYSIQRVLYSYTLVHWLYSCGLAPSLEEVFASYFGGIYYVFIRGCKKDTSNGIYAQTWESYSDLEKEFNNIMNEVKKMRIKGAIANGK